MGERNERKKLPKGSADLPGHAHLPRMSPFLYVGNQYSACLKDFDTVISTVTPYDRDGKPDSSLSSHTLLFEDKHGKESAAAAALAWTRIVEGAALVAKAVSTRQRTLVHCEWGQNRSGSICCAFAVLHLKWSSKDAIKYLREQNLADRHYDGQCPMSNQVFNRMLVKLEKERTQLLRAAQKCKQALLMRRKSTSAAMLLTRKCHTTMGSQQVFWGVRRSIAKRPRPRRVLATRPRQ